MRLGQRIRTMLLADATVTSLVGTQIFPVLAPQGLNPPWVVYSIYLNESLTVLEGSDATRRVAFQLSCHSQTYEGAHLIADAVEAVLQARQVPGLDMSTGPIVSNTKRRDLPPEWDPAWFHVVVDVSAWTTDQ